MTVAEPVATTGTATAAGPAPERVARLSYFFPAHNEEANLEGLVDEALAVLPTLAETFEIIAVNDGSKDRTREIADGPGGALPGRRAGRPPPDQLRLWRRAPVRVRRQPIRAHHVHGRRPPVQGRGPRPADRPIGAGRPPGRRRRVPDQARRPAGPDAVRPGLPAREPTVLRAEGHRRRLRGQALPARGARGHPRGVGRGVLLGRAAHQAAGGRPNASSRWASRTTRERPGRRRAPSPRSSCGPCATSGACG